MNKDDFMITICARGGSKGIANKNIKPLFGYPLISWTIAAAKLWAPNTPIVLSTDSNEICEVAALYGVKSWFMRPPELSVDTAPKVPVIAHALLEAELHFSRQFLYIMDLDVTAPLRRMQDLDTMATIACEGKGEVVYSVCPARRNPYFNMIEVDADGYAHRCKEGNFTSRQKSPTVYDVNASIYVYQREALLSGLNPLSGNRCKIHVMPKRFSIDIDEPEDFEYVEYLLGKLVDEKDGWFGKMLKYLASFHAHKSVHY
jgi:CMP-N,N'-diacetyllegionaminic acid synthase